MWKAAVGRGDNPDSIVDTGVPRSLAPKAASASGFDFTDSVRLASGNIYEVFCYPFLPKSRTLIFQEIYKRAPTGDDLALAVTDIRIDDIHNHGETNSAAPEYRDPFERFNSHRFNRPPDPSIWARDFAKRSRMAAARSTTTPSRSAGPRTK